MMHADTILPFKHAGIRTAADAHDRSRRLVVRLVLAIYLLLIFEGALRKWVLPEYSRALFFLRDPLVIAVYFLALKNRLWGTSPVFLQFGLLLGVLALPLVFVQSISGISAAGNMWLLAGYGWRNYFLYIPLAFVVGATFRAEDIERVVRWTLWLLVPVAVLVAVQFFSPLNSAINVGSADDIASQFRGLGAAVGRTRPMGTFTSDVGQKQFVVSSVAILMSLWLVPAARAFKFPLLLTATGAALTCIAFSGSRGMMVHSAIVLLTCLVVGLVVRERATTGRAFLIPAAVVCAMLLLGPLAFPEAFDVLVTRWSSAYASESQNFSFGIFGRALYGFVDFARLLGDTPLAGYGLGLGGNASTLLGAMVGGRVPVALAETDWARHIIDLGPPLGVLFILYRIGLVSWLGLRTFVATRKSGSPLPLLLFAYVSVELLYGQITGQGTINGYTWLFTGLCLAASEAAVRPALATAVAREASPKPFSNLMR